LLLELEDTTLLEEVEEESLLDDVLVVTLTEVPTPIHEQALEYSAKLVHGEA
jgi:hypothetical protein